MSTVAIIIPAYKNPVHLSVVLYGYTRQTDPDFSIHLVNDGGDTDIEEVVKAYTDRLAIHYHYLAPKTETFRAAAARNLGIRHTTADRIVCMDSDMVPYPNLVALQKEYGAKPIIVMGVRKHVNQGGSEYIRDHVEEFFTYAEQSPDAYCDYIERYTWRDDERYQYEPDFDFKIRRHRDFMCASRPGKKIPDICFTHNLSLPTKEVKQIGGFWEKLVGWGSEDTELCMRLCKLGCTTLADARIAGYHLWHDPPPSNQDFVSRDENVALCNESKQMKNLVRNGGPIP